MVPKEFLNWGSLIDGLRIFVAGLSIVLVGLVLEPISLVACVAGGAITFFVVATALRVLTLDDVDHLRRYVVARSRRRHPSVEGSADV
jgi:hypothetical protein